MERRIGNRTHGITPREFRTLWDHTCTPPENAPENTKLENRRQAEDKQPLCEEAFAILQPAFDKNILSEAQMRVLIDAEEELPFDFIVSLLALYKREQIANFELIRKAMYEEGSLTQFKVEVSFTDIRFLLHKMRGGAMNLGDEPMTKACSKLRQICIDKDLETLANGPGNLPDLVQASKVSASYFERLMKFVQTHTPQSFDCAVGSVQYSDAGSVQYSSTEVERIRP
jgi:hypothetical protein